MLYVAAPYTHPDPVANTHAACMAFDRLVEAGHTPIVPHANMLLHLVTPREPAFWYAYDLELLKRCDGAVFLDGWEDSEGCRKEMLFCAMHMITTMTMDEACV